MRASLVNKRHADLQPWVVNLWVYFFLHWMMGVCRFANAQNMWNMLLIAGIKVIGMRWCKTSCVFIISIMRSTWMGTWAMSCFCCSSSLENGWLPFEKGGITSAALFPATPARMPGNILSARITSPSSIIDKKSEVRTTSFVRLRLVNNQARWSYGY